MKKSFLMVIIVFEILMLIILSVYLFARLWGVLGTRSGNEKQFFSHLKKEDLSASKVKKTIVIKGETEENSPLQYEESKIQETYPNFTFNNFLKGAEAAFKQIIQAYSSNNEELLKKLSTPEVYENFINSIKEQKKLGLVLNTIIHDLDLEIYAVKIEEKVIKITVKFTSNQTITKSKPEGEVIDSQINKLVDIWQFQKKLTNDGNSWLLAEILKK
jgi:predicted lipid-binding transport protein (Tim44 family)